MYPGQYAQERARQPAFIMAGSREVVTYGELERRSNQLAHLLRRHGLGRLDHFAIFMENNSRYLECCAAGERTGLYYTCINSYLTADELAYVVYNSRSKALITSRARREVALQATRQCPNVTLCLIVDGSGDEGPLCRLRLRRDSSGNLSAAVRADYPAAIRSGGLGTAGLSPNTETILSTAGSRVLACLAQVPISGGM